ERLLKLLQHLGWAFFWYLDEMRRRRHELGVEELDIINVVGVIGLDHLNVSGTRNTNSFLTLRILTAKQCREPEGDPIWIPSGMLACLLRCGRFSVVQRFWNKDQIAARAARTMPAWRMTFRERLFPQVSVNRQFVSFRLRRWYGLRLTQS